MSTAKAPAAPSDRICEKGRDLYFPFDLYTCNEKLVCNETARRRYRKTEQYIIYILCI